MEVRFVASYDAAGRRVGRTRDERAHSARAVRQRKKLSVQRDDKAGTTSNKLALRSRSSKPAHVEVRELFEIEDGVEEDDFLQHPGHLENSLPTLDDDNGLQDSIHQPTTISRKTRPPLSYTLSPIFGALNSTTFSSSNSVLAANSARYYLQNVMGNTIALPHQRTWFEAFCRDEMVFECLNYCTYFFQDVRSPRSGLRQTTLKHRVKALQLLKERIRNLDGGRGGEGNSEALALTMTTLWMWSQETDSPGKRKTVGLVESSERMADAWLKSAVGSSTVEESHARALEWVIARVGGLERVGSILPGLQTGLASCDVLSASANATKPRFPSIWEKDFDQIMKSVAHFNLQDYENAFPSLPGTLPFSVISLLDHLRTLSQAVDNPLFSPSALIKARNALQHRLLSLPTWVHLKSACQTEGSYFAIYEVCRLKATLFSNAVFLPIDKALTWRLKLLRELKEVLDVANVAGWKAEEAGRLEVWSLFVGNLVAFGTEEDGWYLKALRRGLERRKFGEGVEDVSGILRGYLWCEGVCSPAIERLRTLLRDDKS